MNFSSMIISYDLALLTYQELAAYLTRSRRDVISPSDRLSFSNDILYGTFAADLPTWIAKNVTSTSVVVQMSKCGA